MKQSQTDFLILGILTFHPEQSGYHIRKTVQSTVGHFWSESYGQLYPALKRLTAQGLVAATEPSGGRRQKLYSITATGQAALADWLARPYRDDPPRNEFLLKLFFGAGAAPSVSLEHLCAFEKQVRGVLELFERIEKLAPQHNSAQPGFVYWMLTLDYGLTQARASLEWCQRAQARLSRN